MRTTAQNRVWLCLCALLLWGVASPAQNAKKPPRFVEKELEYSFQPPDTWKRVETVPRPLVAYAEPKESGFAANFVVNLHGSPVEKGQEEKFLEGVKQEYRKQGSQSAITKTKLAGQPAYAWTATLKTPKAQGLSIAQTVCFYKRRAYVLTFTALSADSKKLAPLYARILASFRFAP